MKDDRILKPRLRLCPFCGSTGAPELRTSGAAAFVHCNTCRADGPVFDITDCIGDYFHSMTEEEQDLEWSNATLAAQHNAMIAWNGRPWEGSYFPDELEDLDRMMKQESDALYGASCSEESEPCGR